VKKRLLLGAGSVVLIVAAALYFFKGGAQKSTYETTEVDRGDIVEKITATGTINPVITVRVGSQVSGRIAKIFADFNAHVQKGQVIAQLETDIYQSRVEQADANFELSKAQTQEARVSFLDAKNNLRRITDLRKGLVASERELEIAETKHMGAQAAYDAAVARGKQAQALLASAQVDLEHATIYSPVDGIVISRNCDVGQTVVASFQTPDLFLIAQDLTRMQVEAYVDEADIGKVQVQQEVRFTVDAFPERIFKGSVSQVRFAPKEEQNVVTYATVIAVSNPDLSLRPGMTATVSIITNEKKDALRVETIALRFKADPDDENMSRLTKEKRAASNDRERLEGVQQSLWLLKSTGDIKSTLIETGISDGKYTEVTGGALKEGERVIVGYATPEGKAGASNRSGFGFRFRRRE
jgi:HlyD family secretion protein